MGRRLRKSRLPTVQRSMMSSSGVYFYKLTAEGQTFTKRMTLLK
ncbi:MAG: T9SS type A sorting domain-containing protein [candidate division Zixibacteria bacterium]|nr:T9SS type A sorting domain-containing protein [candidate division Zixibacteria bacterium]